MPHRPAGAKDFTLLKAATAVNGTTYFYLDGEKLFKMGTKDECLLNLSSAGIVATGPDGTVRSERISSSAYGEYCGDRAESTTLLATLRLGGQTLWIIKANLEDGYDYSLMNPDTGESMQLNGSWDQRQSLEHAVSHARH